MDLIASPTGFTKPLPVDTHNGGGKAGSLALLKSMGLRVPDGFVCTHVLARAMLLDDPAQASTQHVMHADWPQGFTAELERRLKQSDAVTFSVRSSFAGEDKAEALAAGVYESFVNVPAGEVPEALRKVLASALAPAAKAYAQAHGHPPVQAPLCVLVHPYVPGHAWGHAAATLNKVNVWVGSGSLTPAQRAEVEHAATGVAHAHGPSEIEWVHDGAQFVYLQWRPYVPPAPAQPWRPSAPSVNETASPPSDEWVWDASHNPTPLSPAQQGLVALVQEHCDVGFDQHVFGGYLFYRPRAQRTAGYERWITPADIDVRFAELQQRVQADLQTLPQIPTLEAALRLFLQHYAELVGHIGAAVKQGRRDFVDFVKQHAPQAAAQIPHALRPEHGRAVERQQRLADVHAADAARRGHAWSAYLEVFGDEPVAWDVCAPTHRERPMPENFHRKETSQRSQEAASAWAQIKACVDSTRQGELDRLYAIALACAARGEDDDWLYARLQTPIRRALQALGAAWATGGALASADDVFFVPLPLVRAAAAHPQTPAGLREAAAFGKQAYEQQRLNPPPSQGNHGLRGHGTGGRVVGQVRHHKPEQGCHDGSVVLVCKTLLPTELPLLVAAAFVVETGGPLDHVAAQARERGLPAVVGVAGATQELAEGDRVLVDADAGVVVRLEPARS